MEQSLDRKPSLLKRAASLRIRHLRTISSGYTPLRREKGDDVYAEGIVLEKQPTSTSRNSVGATILKLRVGFGKSVEESTRGKIIIHCVRHGEAWSDMNYDGFQIMLDPRLTPHGENQAKLLRSRCYHLMGNITHVFVSPMRRTLQTAQIGFSPLLDRGFKFVAYPDAKDHGNAPASTGRPKENLTEGLGGTFKKHLDTTLVHQGWEKDWFMRGDEKRAERVRKDLYVLGKQALDVKLGSWRGYKIPQMINKDGNVEILLVTHGSFLADLEGSFGERYQNAEYKSFEFVPDNKIKQGRIKYALVETQQSRQRAHVALREDLEQNVKVIN